MLVVKRGASEVDQTNISAFHATNFAILRRHENENSMTHQVKNKKIEANLSCIERGCEIRVHEQNVFRLQISVRQLVVVEELHSVAELVRDVAHVIHLQLSNIVIVDCSLVMLTLNSPDTARSCCP